MLRNLRALSLLSLLSIAGLNLIAAPPDRITRTVDGRRTIALSGHVLTGVQPQADRGAVDPAMQIRDIVLVAKQSPAQQGDLERLLVDQQNPSSPNFRKWLTPEEYGNRFGWSTGDRSKLVAWLNSQGFQVEHLARGQNWIRFSGSAGQVTAALRTPIHNYQIGDKVRFANSNEPSVPEALSEVVGGFIDLNDFPLESTAKFIPADYTTGTVHFLVPEDYATIYNIAPLYQAGIDGTGQSIAVVGQSDIAIADIRAFRTRYNLPANDPKMLPYSTDPGTNGAQIEGTLDLEWAGAIAPKATIYYVFGTSAFTAIVAAVELNVAPIITASYGSCELNYSAPFYRSIAQQANAQGITIVSSSGDYGADGCSLSTPLATHGHIGHFPTTMPEVTSVGGTEFVEGTGNYWATTNTPNFGSALSYIPEAVWNENPVAGGGGPSLVYPKPAWQSGPGVPADNARHYPDVALSAAGHDAYYISLLGTNGGIAGTSAAAPSMAGIVALLNQYQMSKGFIKQPGLGNLNPQLYRLAQSAPTIFHDIVNGDNMIPCLQGSPDCATGFIGYRAGPGYDMASGLGSLDVNALATQWNTATNGVVVTLSISNAKPTLNDTIQATATVSPVGSGTPTGTVDFVYNGLPFGTAPLTNGSATIAVPVYLLGANGTFTIAAEYSGDAAFTSGGASVKLTVTTPTGVSTILPTFPTVVWPQAPDGQGLSWLTTISLRELSGVAALVTGLTIDGQAQTLPQYFPSPAIPPSGTLTANLVFRNLAVPLTRVFVITGTDAAGQSWSRQFSVNYLPPSQGDYSTLAVTPLVVAQNTAADASCQWSVQLNLDQIGGYRDLVTNVSAGGVTMNSLAQITSVFGSPRLDAWDSLQGTLCFGGVTPPATDIVEVDFGGIARQATISFAGPPANPGKITPSPANVTLAAATTAQTVQSTLAVNLSDKSQPWSATIYPPSRASAWLSASQLSGVGSGQITLTANGTGFEPGVYRAVVVIQSPNAVPQYMNVPVMFVLGPSGPAITAVANTASYKTATSPGMLLSVFGMNLASGPLPALGTPLPNSLGGVSVTVNGIPAPLLYVSPGQLNVQLPYEVSAGPAVLGVNNNGQIAGFQFQVSPSAPGIFADANGNTLPSTTAKLGGFATLYVTGAGEVSTLILDGAAPSTLTTLASLPRPVLPFSVTVGGVPVFVQFAGIPPGLVGTMQVNIQLPNSVPTGNQQVVVTVGGVSSAPANLLVQAP